MEVKHTPGPWNFIRAEHGDRCIEAPHSGKVIDTLMCDTAYYPWCPDDDADWRLIAAAPDLLAIVQKLIQARNDSRDTVEFSDLCDLFIEDAQAVLTKAST